MRKLFYKLFPSLQPIETREEFIIRFIDLLIINYTDNDGVIDKNCLNPIWEEGNLAANQPLRPFVNKIWAEVYKGDGHLDIVKDNMTAYFNDIKAYLLREGYINKINAADQKWILSERGFLMKELGGHEEYKKHRKWEINAVKNQTRINVGLLIVAILTVLTPILIEVYKNYHPKGETHTVIIEPDSAHIKRVVEDILKRKNQAPRQLPTPQLTK